MPSPKGLHRTGAKHKRKISPLVPSSSAQDAQGPLVPKVGQSGAVAKRPNSPRKVARVGVRLQEELWAAQEDNLEAEMAALIAEKRLGNALALSKEWRKQHRKWENKQIAKIEAGGTSPAADMQVLQEAIRRQGAVDKAWQAVVDAELAVLEAEARVAVSEAAVLRCELAIANRSGRRK